jgi:RHS repeat-associated protein
VADSTEVRVLRQLYAATGGPQWAVRDNWLQGTTLAEASLWAGVGVSDGDVTSLSLVNNQLRDSLPSSLGQLRALQYLDLRANQLTGRLPAALGQLTQLLSLSISANQFTGALPVELGNLRRLQGFGADHNQFSGPLPAAFGNWADMGWLTLNDNQLTGSLPARWGRMHALGGLFLHNNRLSGALPDSLVRCTQLGVLWLNNNRFTGSFPASWGQFAHLSYVELSANQLSGPLPEELTQLASLGTLNLGGNQLTGPLPTHWERMTGLAGLGLNDNLLDGELPAAFGQLPSLAYCLLQRNQLIGPLPAPAGRGWRRLVHLDVSQNRLHDTLPDSLGNCRALSLLNLSNNQFSGALPTTLGQLTSLEQLHAANNAFTGPLPASLGGLPRLWFVNLTVNQLSGALPGAWGQLRSLRQLYLSNNQLQGLLPDSLGQLAELGYLALDHNQLTGSLPAAWQGLRGLQRLNLEDNQLSGPLPEGLPVAELYLDRNRFSGAMPASYATSPTLRTLSLNENEFTQLPDFNASPNLAQLRLSISDNWLEFDSYERNQPTADAGRWYYWNYSRTQRQPPAATTQVVNGRAARLDGQLGGAYNHYQWQRQVGGQWADMPGATTPSLTWAAVTGAESGTYRTRVVSDWVTGITLYSRPLVLDVVPYQPLAQNRPDDTNQGLGATIAPVDSAAWHTAAAPADVNFVRVWSPRVALTMAARVALAPVDSVSMSTQYLDGLGRPVQSVLRQASPARRDMVQAQAYDGLGREPRTYLPYADSVGGRGGYRPQALRQQDAFYRPSGLLGPPAPDDPTLGVARTGAAYAETQFEASPLNRVTAQGAAGEAWQLTAGHVVEREERPNTAQDSVLWFTPGYDPRSLDPGYQGFYAPGELWGTQVADAHGPSEPGAPGYRTIEWKDKQGQVVLRQVEAGRQGSSSTGLRSRWLRTAYAYDDFGRLRFVLQPEASKRVLALGDQAATLPASALPFLFHYRFDGRGRQVAKQVPGQDGETVVVYDQLDRPVLSQDAAQRQRREWSWTKYDALGRLVLSGLVTRADTLGQVSLQALATADTATAHQYEQRTALAATYPHGLTIDQSFPKLGQQGFGLGQVLSVTYYDDYDFDNDGQPDVAYDASTDGQFPSGQAPVADALRTTGVVTRTRTRVLGVVEGDLTQAAWLTTTTFYDERARPVQVQTTNARKGTDLLTTRLDFTGKVVQSVAVHQVPNLTAPLQVAEFFTYDHTGRLLTARQQLPGEARPALLDSVSYNEVGQAVRKVLGTGRLRQQVDYAYNIRGWLTSLNDPYQPNPTQHDLFGLSLHYERGFTKGYEQYNGNLTGQTWRGRDGVQRAYGYVYDPLNRLLQGDFVARNTTAPATPMAEAWKAEEDNYRLSFVSYDDNGNILTLRRRGLLQNATHARSKQYGAVDNLTYAYQGNRLLAVDDQVTGNQLPRPTNYHGAPTSLAGDFQEAGVKLGEEYLYDANGNLTQDKNKGITEIRYNHLNLPRQIHFGSVGDSIVFHYAASGQKVAKLVYQTGKLVPQRTDYLGPYQYEQDSLKFFPHAEGRVLRFVSTNAAGAATVSYQREFTFKDHLGNLRLAYRAGQTRTYLASLEQDDNTRKRETQQFDSLSVSPPIAVATPWAMGQYAARLNAGGASPQPLGPLTQLTVQKGDSLRVSVSGLYPQKVNNSSFAFSLASFVASLLQPAPAGAPPRADGSRRGGLPLLQVGLNAASLTSVSQLASGVPKGYLRVLVFNQDSVLVDQRKCQLTQDALSHYQVLSDTLSIRRDGYVTVYVGNESLADVYFDELRIEHRQGLQVQENQYDPYGLDLAGVSGAAPSLRLKNYYQFNGKENQLDLGLNWNHHDARFFDYQLGRWHVVDPMVEDGQEHWTPYAFGFDNAVRFNDPDGQNPFVIAGLAGAAIGAVVGAGIEAGTQMYHNGGHVSDWHAVGGAAVQGGVTGGVAGLTGGTSLLRSGAVGAVSNVAGGIARNAYDGKPITVGSVAKDAVIGAATGVAGHAAGKVVGAIANRLKGGAAAAESEAGVAARTVRCGCFSAGTGISTRRGHKAIEQIQVGDSVWAYNERTHSTALRPVTHLFRYERDTVYVLHTATGETLRTTSDHPFYVRGQWVRVKRLRVGDSLVSQSGQRHVLRRIDRQPEHVTVYNFTVDELHTYFVGQNAILVHNSVPCDLAKSPNAQKALDSKYRALESAESGAAKTRTLPDGRVRYIGPEKASSRPGATRGSSYVTENNPKTGQVRAWQENYDQSGNVNRVHPKMINGQQVQSQHYPPTGSELKK